MRKFMFLALTGAALAAGAAALAQTAPMTHPGVATDAAPRAASAPPMAATMTPENRAARRIEMREMMFARLDTNRDGQISQAEFAAAGDRMAAMRGQRGERFGHRGRAGPMARGPGGPGGPGAMADTNRDGTVTRDEFAAAMLQRFDRIDANHDGKISPDERRGPMGGGMRGAGGPGAAG